MNKEGGVRERRKNHLRLFTGLCNTGWKEPVISEAFCHATQLSNFCLHLRTVRFVVFLSRPACYHVFHLTFEESGDN